MKKKKVYLALVDSNFKLTDEVVNYFQSKNVEVIKHFQTIDVLKLQSNKDLTTEKLQFVNHIEKDAEFHLNSEEE